MTDSVFLTRMVLRQYKSLAGCGIRLGPLTCLLGPNGSGKSNFVDALRLVRDSLSNSLDNALSERGGLPEVSRRSSEYPMHFGIRLEFILPDNCTGVYAFQVGVLRGVGVGVWHEECRIGATSGGGPFFRIRQGKVEGTSEDSFPTVTSDRLGLVAASGLTTFRPVFNALTSMAFYDLDPKMMRDLQRPQDGHLLKSSGKNIASVFRRLELSDSESLRVIREYLRSIVPLVHGVQHERLGPAETLEFLQEMAGQTRPWRFWAQEHV